VTLFNVFAGWILSPVIGFFAAATIHFWILRFEESLDSVTDIEVREIWYGRLLGIFLILSTASRAGNDVANSIAPILSLSYIEDMSVDTSWVMVIGGFGVAAGLIVIGWKVIKLVAREIVTMTPASALSAMISVTFVMTTGTLAGLPLSGTHVLIAAMIAVGWAERSKIQRDVVKKIVISWIVTVPLAGIIAILSYWGIDFVVILFTG